MTLGLSHPYSVALDVDSSHVWVGNLSSTGLSVLTISGSVAASYMVGSGTRGFIDAEIDGSGYVWTSDTTGNALYKLAADGTQSGATITGNGLGARAASPLQPDLPATFGLRTMKIVA